MLHPDLCPIPLPCPVPSSGSYSSITAAPRAGASQTLSLRPPSPTEATPGEISSPLPSLCLRKLPK